MSGRINGIPIICATKPARCEQCGKIKELRPYGKDGANVCFTCANKDPVNMKKRFNKLLYGE